MAQGKLIFSSYTLTQEEQLAGETLSALSIQVLHNLRSRLAEQKLYLPFTPNDVLAYAQQEAFLTGQLELLTFLIDSAEAANSHQVTQGE